MPELDILFEMHTAQSTDAEAITQSAEVGWQQC